MLMTLIPGLNFISVIHTAFMLIDPKSAKNTVKSLVSFYAFGIYKHKSCTKNVDEIDTCLAVVGIRSPTCEEESVDAKKSLPESEKTYHNVHLKQRCPIR